MRFEALSRLLRPLNPDVLGAMGSRLLLLSVVTNLDEQARLDANTFLIDLRERRVFPGLTAIRLLVDEKTARTASEDARLAAERYFDSRMRKAHGVYGESLCDEILRGPLSLCYLINCPGGHGIMMKWLETAAQVIRERGGKASAFVTTNAQSAGGMILFSVERSHRFVLSDSVVMLHAAHQGDDDEPPANEEHVKDIEEDTKRIATHLESSVGAQHLEGIRGRLAAVRADEANIYNAIAFRGSELADLGAVNRSVDDPRELATLLHDETGIRLERGQGGNPISDYFYLATAELQIRQRTGVRVQLDALPPNGFEVVSRPPVDPEVTDEMRQSIQGALDELFA
jgi:Clp protease